MKKYKTVTFIEEDEDGTPKQNPAAAVDKFIFMDDDDELTSSSSVVSEEDRLEIAKFKDEQSKRQDEDEEMRQMREETMQLQAEDERAIKTQLSSLGIED